MASVFRPTRPDPKNPGKRVKYKTWYIQYKNENGDWVKEPGYRDKAASEALAKKKEKEAELRRAGVEPEEPGDEDKGIDECFAAWADTMRLEGRSARYVYIAQKLWERARDRLGWKTVKDVKPGPLMEWMMEMRREGKSAGAANSYRSVGMRVLGVCVERGWLKSNPLKAVRKAREEKGKKHRPRRAYTVQEVQAMLGVAEGPRRLAYLIAALSGLRKEEVRELTREDFTPTGERPLWHLRPEIDKMGQKARVPMSAELAAELLPLWRKLKPGERLLPGLGKMQWALETDLERAGIAKKDESGRSVDFHSFRYFFCTQMARTLPIQKVKRLMRHANIALTCDLYMDLGLDDVGEEVWSLPSVLAPEKAPEKAPGKPASGKRTPTGTPTPGVNGKKSLK